MGEVDSGCLAGTMEGVLWKLDAGVILGVVRVVDVDPFTPPSTETELEPPFEVGRTSCIASSESPGSKGWGKGTRPRGVITQ